MGKGTACISNQDFIQKFDLNEINFSLHIGVLNCITDTFVHAIYYSYSRGYHLRAYVFLVYSNITVTALLGTSLYIGVFILLEVLSFHKRC